MSAVAAPRHRIVLVRFAKAARARPELPDRLGVGLAGGLGRGDPPPGLGGSGGSGTREDAVSTVVDGCLYRRVVARRRGVWVQVRGDGRVAQVVVRGEPQRHRGVVGEAGVEAVVEKGGAGAQGPRAAAVRAVVGASAGQRGGGAAAGRALSLNASRCRPCARRRSRADRRRTGAAKPAHRGPRWFPCGVGHRRRMYE